MFHALKKWNRCLDHVMKDVIERNWLLKRVVHDNLSLLWLSVVPFPVRELVTHIRSLFVSQEVVHLNLDYHRRNF